MTVEQVTLGLLCAVFLGCLALALVGLWRLHRLPIPQRATHPAGRRARAIQTEDRIAWAGAEAEELLERMPTDEIPAIGLNLSAYPTQENQ